MALDLSHIYHNRVLRPSLYEAVSQAEQIRIPNGDSCDTLAPTYHASCRAKLSLQKYHRPLPQHIQIDIHRCLLKGASGQGLLYLSLLNIAGQNPSPQQL